MPPTASTTDSTQAQVRSLLATRLRARREELVQSALNRARAVAESPVADDPEYAEGLRAAVAAAIEYGLGALEHGEERAPPIPETLLGQARMAARTGVGLDLVLRRYVSGYGLLSDFIAEAAAAELPGDRVLQEVARDQAVLLDRLLDAVCEAYHREAMRRRDSTERRRVERVVGLLDGELLDASDLAYDLDAFHVGMVAVGPRAVATLREVAAVLDVRLLAVRPDLDRTWAWFGARRQIDPESLHAVLDKHWTASAPLAIGEPAQGLSGWRLTHHQARAALPVALSGSRRVVRYAAVALIAAALQDDLLAVSLRTLYLAPLEAERDGGETSRATLRAYFATGRNASSAASALKVSRRTVTNRLRAIEDRLSPLPGATGAEMEVALRLREVTSATPSQAGKIPSPQSTNRNGRQSRASRG